MLGGVAMGPLLLAPGSATGVAGSLPLPLVLATAASELFFWGEGMAAVILATTSFRLSEWSAKNELPHATLLGSCWNRVTYNSQLLLP